MEFQEFTNKIMDVLHELPEKAGGIILENIKTGIEQAVSIDGKSYPPLAPATMEKTGRTKPLDSQGFLDDFSKSIQGKNINIKNSRDYSSYLNDRYNFMGISNAANEQISQSVQNDLDKI